MLSKATIRKFLAQRKDSAGLERLSWDVEERDLRVEGDADTTKLIGHAALFDTFSLPLGSFKEIIRKGAFRESLKNDEVLMLWNHNTDYVMASKSDGRLKVSEDKVGLRFESTPNLNISWNSDGMKSVSDGTTKRMSFRFEALKDRWGSEDGETIRELLKVRVAEISPVAFPAYPTTSVEARSVFADNGIEIDLLANALERIRSGETLEDSEMEIVQKSLDILNRSFSKHTDDDDRRELLSVKVKRLDLVEKYL